MDGFRINRDLITYLDTTCSAPWNVFWPSAMDRCGAVTRGDV
jgi:hypothetical protein